ncbi:MAG: thymidine kinase [Bacilli bacterium]|nr:thymidine kinase [Bacilli bacterium]
MSKLHFKYGTMNSGKSIDLMRTAHNYEEVGYDVIVMKPIIDTKGNDKLDSRIGIQRKVDILIKEDDMILKLIKNKITEKTACIFVDEAQFLKEKQIDELFFITKKLNIPVICYGLRTNFKAESFEGSKRLLEIAEELEELPTLCDCKEIARFVGRKVNNQYVLEGNEIEIDGDNENIEYIPLCGKCYLEKVKKIKF